MPVNPAQFPQDLMDAAQKEPVIDKIKALDMNFDLDEADPREIGRKMDDI